MALSGVILIAGLYQLYVLNDKRDHVMISLVGSGFVCLWHGSLLILSLM